MTVWLMKGGGAGGGTGVSVIKIQLFINQNLLYDSLTIYKTEPFLWQFWQTFDIQCIILISSFHYTLTEWGNVQ